MFTSKIILKRSLEDWSGGEFGLGYRKLTDFVNKIQESDTMAILI